MQLGPKRNFPRRSELDDDLRREALPRPGGTLGPVQIDIPPLGVHVEHDHATKTTRALTHYSFKGLFRADERLAESLLEKYCERLVEAFPDPNEREDLAEIATYLRSAEDPYDILLSIESTCSEGNVGSSTIEPVGGAQYQILDCSLPVRCGVLENLWVTRECRTRWYGPLIERNFEAFMQSQKVQIIFGELNDASLMTEIEVAEDSARGADPRKRALFWRNLGYFQVQAPYVQPPLEGDPTNEAVWYLMPAVKILDRGILHNGMLPARAYLSILEAYFDTFVEDAANSAVFRSIKSQIQSAYLPLISVLDRRPEDSIQQGCSSNRRGNGS